MVKCIHKRAIELGFSVLCIAPTGIAASNLPQGKTVHSAFNFTITMKMRTFLSDLSTDQLNRLRRRIDTSNLALVVFDEISYSGQSDRTDPSNLAVVVFYEISYLGPEMLGQIDNRLRQLMSCPETPFGGVSLAAMGDLYQLPPVKACSLFQSTWSNLVERKEIEEVETPYSRGVDLFSQLQKFDLHQQMRAAEDKNHTDMLNQMRNPDPRAKRINRRAIKSLKTITSQDYQENPDWLKASLVVTSNRERYLINDLRSEQWARSSGNHRFVWEYPLVGNLASTVRTPGHQLIYRNYPEFSGCFVAGAPGFLSENINPNLGLSNGTPIIYHSLTLHANENVEAVQAQMNSGVSQEIKLKFPPSYIHVVVPGANPEDFLR